MSSAAVAQRTAGVRTLLLDRGLSGPQVAAAPWLLAGAKTLSYAINMAALRYAVAHDADDVIFVGSDGAILEAPTATVVVANGRALLTPPLDGVLDGITVVRLIRAAQAAGWETAYRRLTRRTSRRPTACGWPPVFACSHRSSASTRSNGRMAG